MYKIKIHLFLIKFLLSIVMLLPCNDVNSENLVESDKKIENPKKTKEKKEFNNYFEINQKFSDFNDLAYQIYKNQTNSLIVSNYYSQNYALNPATELYDTNDQYRASGKNYKYSRKFGENKIFSPFIGIILFDKMNINSKSESLYLYSGTYSKDTISTTNNQFNVRAGIGPIDYTKEISIELSLGMESSKVKGSFSQFNTGLSPLRNNIGYNYITYGNANLTSNIVYLNFAFNLAFFYGQFTYNHINGSMNMNAVGRETIPNQRNISNFIFTLSQDINKSNMTRAEFGINVNLGLGVEKPNQTGIPISLRIGVAYEWYKINYSSSDNLIYLNSSGFNYGSPFPKPPTKFTIPSINIALFFKF
ncbi:MAG: hypothetical protein KDK54_20550 [Leptospiraceae bacterium]|nr:hypothetical protein [Leptospiraceae bacterium]